MPAATAGPPLVFSGLAVPAGGSAVLVYRARVNQYAPPAAGGSITNTISVTGAGLSSVPTATETVEAAERPILSVVKSLSPTSVTANSRVTYTFVIQNAGNTAAEATEAAVLSDVFDPILADLSVTFDGAPWSAPAHYAYDADTGAFSTVPGQLTVPAATAEQADDGSWTIRPGRSTLVVSGTV